MQLQQQGAFNSAQQQPAQQQGQQSVLHDGFGQQPPPQHAQQKQQHLPQQQLLQQHQQQQSAASEASMATLQVMLCWDHCTLPYIRLNADNHAHPDRIVPTWDVDEQAGADGLAAARLGGLAVTAHPAYSQYAAQLQVSLCLLVRPSVRPSLVNTQRIGHRPCWRTPESLTIAPHVRQLSIRPALLMTCHPLARAATAEHGAPGAVRGHQAAVRGAPAAGAPGTAGHAGAGARLDCNTACICRSALVSRSICKPHA